MKTDNNTQDPQTADEKDRLPDTIEDAFAQLQAILDRMNAQDISLEESFACYERGMKLIRYCNETIDKVEKKVQVLNAEGEITDFT